MLLHILLHKQVYICVKNGPDMFEHISVSCMGENLKKTSFIMKSIFFFTLISIHNLPNRDK